jgi:hypothetical protein
MKAILKKTSTITGLIRSLFIMCLYLAISPLGAQSCFPNIATIGTHSIKMCPNEKINLTASGGVDGYTWTPSTGLSCTACASPTLTAGTQDVTYTVSSTSGGSFCGSYSFTLQISSDCEKDEIIGCCFSNYGAAVWVNNSNTYLNIYCNLLNELGYTAAATPTLQKGEFKNINGSVRVLLNWYHNAKNTLYLTNEGITSLFGADQTIKGNSNTWFNELRLNGNGTKSLWINAYGTSSLNLSTNIFDIQNYAYFMKEPTSGVIRSSGYANTSLNGYFSWAMANAAVITNQNYLFPLGSTASASNPFRYRPLVMGNNSTTQTDEISANFMNTQPSLVTDPVYTHTNTGLVNVVSNQAPNVLQVNNAFYHKIKQTTASVTYTSDVRIESYYLPVDGQFQSLSEWEKDAAQVLDWWGGTPGAGASTVASTDAGTYGMLYAMADGTLNFNHKPFTLSRGGFYINTNSFGNGQGTGNGAVISVSATPQGGSPTPNGGGLNNPFGTGGYSGNNGGGGNTVFSPNPVAGQYVMTIAPTNNCAIPGKVKFVIDQNGNISPSSVEYGLDGAPGYLGKLSEAVYTIDNQNSGITFSATPAELLKTCVNSITITTTNGTDHVYSYTTPENISVSLPTPTGGNTFTYGQFKIYNTASSLRYTSSALSAGANIFTPVDQVSSSNLAAGVYRFELTVSASGSSSISETLKGQIIVK